MDQTSGETVADLIFPEAMHHHTLLMHADGHAALIPWCLPSGSIEAGHHHGLLPHLGMHRKAWLFRPTATALMRGHTFKHRFGVSVAFRKISFFD